MTGGTVSREAALATQLAMETYSRAEERARRASTLSMVLAVGALMGVIGVGLIALLLTRSEGAGSVIPYLVMATGFGLLALVAIVRLLRQDRAAEELGRVRRQLRVVDAYTADLPDDVGVLLKSLAAPRVMTEQHADEPWSSPAWPAPEHILKLIELRERSQQVPTP